jgi:hypothetical protein
VAADRLAPPVRESDDPQHAANLRRGALTRTAGSALECFTFALYGLASALIFNNRHRYLGVANSREFRAVIGGGLAGVLGVLLIEQFDGSWVPLVGYAFVLTIITFATTFITPETKAPDLTNLPDALHEIRADGVQTVDATR